MQMDDGQWTMEDELSLPMGEFTFLVNFNHLTNCQISAKPTKLSAMAAGYVSQTATVQIAHVFVLCYFTFFLKIDHVQF